jgi:hypothetical protein
VRTPTLVAVGSILLALGLSCKRKEATASMPVFAAPPSSVAAKPSQVLQTRPATRVIPTVKEIAWTLPHGRLTSAEKPLVGTWVATVDELAARTAFMSGFVGFNLQGRDNGIAGIVDAIGKKDRLKTNCIWLELFEDRRGIRRECALVNGEPSALDLSSPLDGAKKDSGVKLEWYVAGAKGVWLRYEADLLVPSADPKTKEPRDLRVRHQILALGKKVSEHGVEVRESFPEHDYELPARYVYEIYAGRFLGDK